MQGDQLLLQWRNAKQQCKKLIQLSIQSNITPSSLSLSSTSSTQVNPPVAMKQTSNQFLRIYNLVYSLCSSTDIDQNRTIMVYKDYQQLLKNAITAMAKYITLERDIHRLRMLRLVYNGYEDVLKRMRHMFAYLNRPYCVNEGKIEELDRTGVGIFVAGVMNQELVGQYAVIYFKALSKIRKTHDLTDGQILKQYVQILYNIHLRLTKKQQKRPRTLYTDFHQQYLSQCRQYYVHHITKLLELSPSQYFLQANALFQWERRVYEQCFGLGGERGINTIFGNVFLQGYRDKLIQGGLRGILQKGDSTVIGVITGLYMRLTGGIQGFKEPFEGFVYEQFTSMLLQMRSQLLVSKKQQTCMSFIQSLIKKSNSLTELLQSSFMKYSQFIAYYKSGLERAFTRNPLQIPIEEMLALYCDIKFKSAYNSHDAMKEDIGNIRQLFQCLENKDFFLMKYLQKLAKRIMTLPMESIENHQQFVYFIKSFSGNTIAQKLQTLLDQYKLSAQQTQSLHKLMENHKKLPYHLTLTTFTESVWPFQQILTFKIEHLPQIFQIGMNAIKIFEKQCMQKRTLKISWMDCRVRWVYYFGDCEKREEKATSLGKIGPKEEEKEEKKEEDTIEEKMQERQQMRMVEKVKTRHNKFDEAYFDTNGVQALLLNYIYKHRPQKIPLQIIQQIFKQVNQNTLKQSLLKMSDSSDPVLLKFPSSLQSSPSKPSEDHLLFSFNPALQTQKRILHFNTPLQPTPQSTLFQTQQLSKQREYVLDSNIAKIMKTRKTMQFDKLIEQVSKMTKVFTPSARDIKMSVERLIGKDIIVRDERDRGCIKYKN